MRLVFVMINLFLISVALTSCSSAGIYEGSSRQMESSSQSEIQRQIIKSANIRIEVEAPNKTAEEIKNHVKAISGYVDKSYNRDKKSVSLTVKVPQPKLESFLAHVAKKGKVLSKSIHSRDVTNELVDINARLKNLTSLRSKFRILLDRAKTVDEILTIEKELSRIQTDIDRIEGHRKSLKNQVELSSVYIEIEQTTIYGPLGYLGKGLFWVVEKLFVIR